MDRITMRPVSIAESPVCWNCGTSIANGTTDARYMYRGPQARTAIVEDWVACSCGAFQNIRQLKEIRITPARENKKP